MKGFRDSAKKLSDRTYEVLEAEIVSRNLKPGKMLKEEEIARRLNVSTIPVREAFNKLEKEGLIYRKPHCSAVVKALKEQDVHELYEIREALECLAIQLAAKKISKPQVQELRKINAKSEKLLIEGPVEDYVRTNREFHDYIRSVAGNDRLEAILRNIHNQLTILMITTAKIPGKSKSAISQHNEMIKALSSQNEDLAVKRMRSHIRESLDDVLNNVLIHDDGI